MIEVNLVLCFLVVAGASAQTATKTVLYNSSDLSYLSNGIQFPVPSSLEADPSDVDSKLPDMEWITRLFDHHIWDARLDLLKDVRCQEEMRSYVEHLKNGTPWATKMYDASGRYSDMFFFGNDFWLGSYSLCWDLEKPEFYGEVPPFPVHFYVAKLRLNLNKILTPVTRQINLGECLPKSCGTVEIQQLLTQEKSQATSLSVVDVRAIPGSYSIFEDVKFHIVGGSALAAAVLVIIASFVEVFTRKREPKEDVEVQNNNNNDQEAKAYDVSPQRSKKHKDKAGSAKKPEQGVFLRLVLSFSALSNGKKILSFDKPSPDSICCLHGLRCFSILWIVLVHTYLEVFSLSENKTLRTVIERSSIYQTVSNATFSVDTFFFISGLLVTITYFRTAAKHPPKAEENTGKAVAGGTLKFFILLFYRFIRLTPAYLFVIGVNEVVLKYTHNNSVFSPAIYDHITCEKFWWRNALYINNFYPQREFCMLWSWYLANDTQFYVFAALLLLFAVRGNKHVKWTSAVLCVFLFASWVTTFIIAMKYNYVARVEEPFALFDQLYDKPWSRIGPYIIGMATGYLLFKINKYKLSPLVVIAGWTLSIATLTSLVYGLGSDGLVVPISAIYSALGHTAWGLSLAWITVACTWGFGGPIDSILRFRGFLPLSRLTFCAYLIHPVLMVATSFRTDGPMHLHNAMVLVIFLGNAVASFILAFLISLAFEAPIMGLLKIIFSPRREGKKNEPI